MVAHNSEKGGNQNKGKSSRSQGRVRKVTKKHVLLPPLKFEWPVVDESTEDNILAALTRKLQEFPRLEKGSIKLSQKTGSEDDTAASQEDAEDLIRAKIRQQLMIGHRQVSKGLERGQLNLVLVWGRVQPPLLLKSLLPLAASRACPAICLQNLMPRITEVTGLSSLIAIGFKKSVPGFDDFADFITETVSLAPPLSLLGIVQSKASKEAESLSVSGIGQSKPSEESEAESKDDVDGSVTDDGSSAAENNTAGLAEIDWPLMPAEQEEQLLLKLNVLLTSYKDVFKKPKPRFVTKDWKSRKVLIRSYLVTDAVALSDAARTGKLSALLVQHESCSRDVGLAFTVAMAVQNKCPVLHLTALKKQVSSLVRNPLLVALGFRKATDKFPTQPKKLTELIDFASQCAPEDLHTLLPAPTGSEQPKEENSSEKTTTALEALVKNAPRPKKTPIPVYDVSHMYVYKTDSVTNTGSENGRQEETDSKEKETTLSEQTESEERKTTLSEETGNKERKTTLSEETDSKEIKPSPSEEIDQGTNDVSSSEETTTVQILGLKDGLSNYTTAGAVFIDTRGSSFPTKKQQAAQEASEEGKAGDSFDDDDDFVVTGIMGADVTDSPSVSEPVYPRRKNRKALKRKLAKMQTSETFLSLSLTPTSVATSVSNPKKAKKNKRKKKN